MSINSAYENSISFSQSTWSDEIDGVFLYIVSIREISRFPKSTEKTSFYVAGQLLFHLKYEKRPPGNNFNLGDDSIMTKIITPKGLFRNNDDSNEV